MTRDLGRARHDRVIAVEYTQIEAVAAFIAKRRPVFRPEA